MNFRTTYILLAVVIIALAILGIIALTSSDKSTAPSVEGFLLKSLRAADVKPDAINTVEIDLPGQTPDKIAFAREGKGWVMVSPMKARADGAAVEALVSGLLNAKTEKSADISSNLGVHGLDNPPVKITLKSEKLSETLSVGNVTIGGSSAVVYVLTSDQPDRAQAVKKNDLFALFKSEPPKGATGTAQLVKSITDFRPLKIIGDGINGPIEQVVRSMAVRTDKDEIAIFREPGGAWKFREPKNFGEAASEAPESFGPGKEGPGAIGSVGQLLNTISNIQPTNRTQIIEAGGDFTKYGLETKANPLQIDIVRDDGVKETMYVSGPIKVGDVEKHYARHEADSVVYEVPAEPIKKVLAALANKNALRDRRVLRLTPMRIDAIDIDTAGEKVELRRVGFGWNLYDAEGKGRPANRRAVEELMSRLTSPQLAASFPPPGIPDDKMGFTKPTGEIRIWEGGIVPPKADTKVDLNMKPQVTATPTVRLVLGVKDVGDVVYLRRLMGDTKTDFFLPADAHQLVSRGRLDYIEASLKPLSFDPTMKQVLKLTFTRGKEVFELERPDDGKAASATAWKINSPERLKGRAADATTIINLLQQLLALDARRVVSDKVTPDVLNRLKVNVDDNRLKVTATVKEPKDPTAKESKETVERVYYFGEDVGTDKKNVYMKPGDQDLVVEVERFAFDQFQKADVMDMVVHKIDKVNIKAVKITGWQEVLGAPATIEIERKEGKWTLNSGGMFELDPNKVDAFLNDVTTPRADAFVVFKTGPTPVHNLDVAKNALAIELTMEKGDPVKMTISPPNKEGKVFATSSALPGDVFTMPDKFATVRAKPAALKKD
jgi:hypothetical protein